MSRMRRTVLAALAAVVVGGAVAVPAAIADFIITFKDYQVGGSLTVRKLNQSVDLPPGSTFNGTADLARRTIHGDVFIPEFTSTIKVLGIPTQVTTKLQQVDPVDGTLAFDTEGVSIRSSTSAILHIRKLRLGLISVPTTCRTARPMVLAMNYDGPLNFPIAFDGTTAIPRLIHCGVLGPTLTALMSGPNNPYHITLAPPAAQ
jgi:hypothetical protein